VSTLIGYGSPNKADSHDVHGAPLGAEETALTRKNLNWEHGEFEVPQDVMSIFRQVRWECTHLFWFCLFLRRKTTWVSLTCRHILPEGDRG